LVDDKNKTYSFERNYDDKKIIIAINNSEHSRNILLSVDESGAFIDVLNGFPITKSEKQQIKLHLPPFGAAVLAKQ
jgi:hypothetical protein